LSGVGLLAVLGTILPPVNHTVNNTLHASKNNDVFNKIIIILAIVVVSAIIISQLWLQLLKSFPGPIVYISVILPIVGFAGFAAYSALRMGSDQVWMGSAISNGIMAIFMLIYFFIIRSRIPFAIELIKAVTSVIQQYPGTQVVALGGHFAHFIWSALLSYTLYACLDKFTGGMQAGIYFYLLFSLYWTSEVIKNVVHVTVSGVLATWYFQANAYSMPQSPTLYSLKRAVTTSFGSICLGSLIVAILKLARAIIRSMKGRANSLLICLLDCILSCIERLVQYFNHYAFCQVAIYGKDFFQAATSTWQLLSTEFFQAIINDNIISGVLSMGCFFLSLVTALIGGFATFLLIGSDLTYIIVIAIVGFVIGFLLMSLSSQVVDSGVTCTFVCFAEDKEPLHNNNPELYQKLTTTYNYQGF